jgi:RNA polymerase sigma-70 factor (ECF subfamily)
VFLRVVRGVQQYQTIGREAAWVYRIARHVLVDHQRKHAERPRSLTEADAGDAAGPPSQVVAFGLQEAVSRLPEAEREVFLLRELAGLTYREIALVCETTEDGVWARLYRARNRLRGLLSGRLSLGTRPGSERGTP